MIYDATEVREDLLEFIDRLKERVRDGEVLGIAGWTTEVEEGDWCVRQFSMGRYDHKDLIYGAHEFVHTLMHGELD